jgi:hypothetical protein
LELHCTLTQAGWLESLTTDDRERIVQNWTDPMGELQQKIMFFKYNGNVAASMVPKKK